MGAGYIPVLTLSALELGVEVAGAGAAGSRRGGGTGLAVQGEVYRGTHTTLLQVHTLRAPLVDQVG